MIRSRWLCLQGLVLLVLFLTMAQAVAQRGGGMCPYLFSMSNQMNVQMNFRPPMQSMNQYTQHSFGSAGYPLGSLSPRQSSCGSMQMTSSYRRPPLTLPTPTATSHVSMTSHNLIRETTSISHLSLFHPSLVQYRSSLLTGSIGHGGTTPGFGRVTSFTTISLHRTTRTLSTTSLTHSTGGKQQIDLVAGARPHTLPGLERSTALSEVRHQTVRPPEPILRPSAPEMSSKVVTATKTHHATPEIQAQVTSKVSVTCGKCHANGIPQGGQVANKGNPGQPQAGLAAPAPAPAPMARPNNPGQPLLVAVPPMRPQPPVVVRPPVVPALLAVPALPPAPTLPPVVVAPSVRPTMGITPSDKNATTLQPTTTRPTTVTTPVDSTLTQPVDRQLPVTLEVPALPVSQTIQPLAGTTEVLDKLPSTPTYTLAPKPSSVAPSLTPGDVFGAPVLPGGVSLAPLVLDAPQDAEPARTESYLGMPPLPTTQPDAGS